MRYMAAASPGGVITRALVAWSTWEASNDAATRAALRTMIDANATWHRQGIAATVSYQGIEAVLGYLDRPARLLHIAGMQVASPTTPTLDPSGQYVIRYGLYSAANPHPDTVTLTVALTATGMMKEVWQQFGDPARWAKE
jgi:hypothetical protein